ncbi:uncharacterized protein LOC128883029 isoform X2 [Hylaeus volcanicus]|uniref:uncharacterized protein LOC128883029 isoform X2 n=1 Tax=Hylaeus volcanicus TaxID=313075 RepID=UPI0023B831FF|nr:uncharacterized protein LOC128883029 isoform X2 [Hylaeus volcanicus]
MQTNDSIAQYDGVDIKDDSELESLHSFINLYKCCINDYNELHTIVKQNEVLRQNILVLNSQKTLRGNSHATQKKTLDGIGCTKRSKDRKNCIHGIFLHLKHIPAQFVNKAPKLKQKRHGYNEGGRTALVLSKSHPDQTSVCFQYELTISRLLGNLNVKNVYVSSLICLQKHRLLKELLELFHVKLDDAFPTLKGFSIFSLNEYFSRVNTIKPADFWIIGTSLGFLAHFTHLFAKYLDLPLSGKFILHSSMSYIVKNDSTAHLHCSDLKNPFSSQNYNEVAMGGQTKDTAHNDNLTKDVLNQSNFCMPYGTLCEGQNLHNAFKSIFHENSPTNTTFYLRSSSLLPVDEKKTSLEVLSNVVPNSSVYNSLETIGLVQWPTTDSILASLPDSTTTRLQSTLSFFSTKKKNTNLSYSLPFSLLNWTCLPLFLRTTQEADKLLLSQGLLTLQSTIRQLCSVYESENGCNLLNPLQKNFIKSYPIKNSTNFLKMISTEYTKETPSLFDPFRRMIAYELLYKSVKH